MATNNVIGYAGLVFMLVGGFAAMIPWKSRRLSTRSIQRRIYWAGCIAASTLVFVSQLPDWRAALFITFAVSFTLILMAWRFTSHLKIRGKIYAASPYDREPDPPPALGPQDD